MPCANFDGNSLTAFKDSQKAFGLLLVDMV